MVQASQTFSTGAFTVVSTVMDVFSAVAIIRLFKVNRTDEYKFKQGLRKACWGKTTKEGGYATNRMKMEFYVLLPSTRR